MNLFNIKKSYVIKSEKNWDTIFWMIDVHDTIFPGVYTQNQDYKFYRWSKEVLQFLSKQLDTHLILYTCSHTHEINRMLTTFELNDIYFDSVNLNKCVPNTPLGCYNDKPYFNILLEDKAGFEPSDWINVKEILEQIYEVKI